MEELRAANVRRLLLLPLYPQYAAATTASTFDAVAGILARWRWLPELRMINHYHDDAGYIEALAASIRAFWAREGRPDKLLFSFHGLPRFHLLAGDPYHCECHKTARLVSDALEMKEHEWMLAFQSRFGKAEWLKPYTSETLRALPAQGCKRVDVICPGFAADCLETLEEIAMQNRDVFLQAGGQQYRYIPALNDDPAHLDALLNLIRNHTRGWAETNDTWDSAAVEQALEKSRERARMAGAPR
jgi:ferrochelatase